MRKLILALVLLLVSCLPQVLRAAVIDTSEWETKPGAPWSYSGTIVDCTVPVSPAGGCALRFTYPAGTYTTIIILTCTNIPSPVVPFFLSLPLSLSLEFEGGKSHARIRTFT